MNRRILALFVVVLLSIPFVCSQQMQTGNLFNRGRPTLSGEDFDKRFKESYLALSTREPEVTELEKAILEKVSPMIQNSPEHAKSMLQDLLSEGKPVSAAFNHALGNLYYESGDFLKAEIDYLAAIEKHNDFQRAWNGLGLTRFQLNDYEGALKALSESIRLGASDSLTYGVLGYCHLQLGHHKSAEVAYNLAILNDPDSTEWSEGIAQIYMETERYDDARRLFGQLLRQQPENVSYWLLLGNAWLSLDEPLKTARSIEIARSFGEVDGSALFLLGNIYLKHEVYDSAYEVLMAAVDQDSPQKDIAALKAIRYLISEDKIDYARDIFGRLSSFSDDWDGETKTMRSLAMAEFAMADGEDAAAIEAFEKSLETDPFNGSTLIKLARLYADNDQSEKSHYLLERAQKDTKYELPALVFQTKLLLEDQRIADSLPLLERAVKLSPTERLSDLYSQVKLAAALAN